MVLQGDFEIQLVEAATKTPFKEHFKDGKHYIEVEPEAEYYICARKVGSRFVGNADIAMDFFVDGQSLGIRTVFTRHEPFMAPSYHGLRSTTNGVSTTRALKFCKPRLVPGSASGGSSRSLTGKVEVVLYSGWIEGVHQPVDYAATSSFVAPPVVDGNQIGRGQRLQQKNVRSMEGTASYSRPGRESVSFIPRAHLDTITLNYCSAPGLMEVGVLPKLDLWTAHRMVHEAKPARVSIEPEIIKIRNDALGIDKEYELFDFTREDPDDE